VNSISRGSVTFETVRALADTYQCRYMCCNLKVSVDFIYICHVTTVQNCYTASEAPGLPTKVALPAQSVTIHAVLVSAWLSIVICLFHEPEQLGL